MQFAPGKVGKDFIYYEDNKTIAESIVLRLLKPLNDGKKRNIFFYGWYSSISLLNKLSNMRYLNTTVLKNNAKDMPSKIKEDGYYSAYKNNILIQKYEDKKNIYFATNYYINTDNLRNTYNIKNRGVDIFAQFLEKGSIQRKTKKWYKKILLYGIDCSIINVKILCDLRYGSVTPTIIFKERIVKYIFQKIEETRENGKIIEQNNNNNYIPKNIREKIHNIGHLVNKKEHVKIVLKKRLIYVLNVIFVYIQNALQNIIIIIFIIKNTIFNFFENTLK